MKGKNTAQFFLLRRESALWKYKTYARAAATTKWCSTKFQAVNVEIQIAFATVGVSGKRDVNGLCQSSATMAYTIALNWSILRGRQIEKSGAAPNEMKWNNFYNLLAFAWIMLFYTRCILTMCARTLCRLTFFFFAHRLAPCNIFRNISKIKCTSKNEFSQFFAVSYFLLYLKYRIIRTKQENATRVKKTIKNGLKNSKRREYDSGNTARFVEETKKKWNWNSIVIMLRLRKKCVFFSFLSRWNSKQCCEDVERRSELINCLNGSHFIECVFLNRNSFYGFFGFVTFKVVNFGDESSFFIHDLFIATTLWKKRK